MIHIIVLPVLKTLAGAVLEPYTSEVKNVALNSLRDTLESAVSGRRSLEAWGELVAPVIDQRAVHIVRSEGLQYVGGQLKFYFPTKSQDKVELKYDLYFVDDNSKWTKESATSDVYASNFTHEALSEIRESGEVVFELAVDDQ